MLLAEPVKPREVKTPLKDFLLKMKQESRKENLSTIYGFTDRIIDGLSLRLKTFEARIFTLGTSPSKVYGEWTPPYILFSANNFFLRTTDKDFKPLPLKLCLQFNPKPHEDIFVFRRGTLESVSIELKHPSNDPTYGLKSYSAYKPVDFKIIDNLTFTLNVCSLLLRNRMMIFCFTLILYIYIIIIHLYIIYLFRLRKGSLE